MYYVGTFSIYLYLVLPIVKGGADKKKKDENAKQ